MAFWLLVALMILSFCSSCTTTKYIPVETIKERTTIKTDTFLMRDSVRDSIFVSIKTKGDTVFSTREIYKTKYLTRATIKTDTVIQRDTIPKIITAERTKTAWEAIIQGLGTGVMIVTVILAIVRVIAKKMG